MVSSFKDTFRLISFLLTFSTLGFSADTILNYFFLNFSQKTGFGENLHEQCQILFSGKNKKKNITYLSSAELAQRVVKVNLQVVH